MAPEDNALACLDTRDDKGAADIVKSIDYTALSECSVGIDTFFSLWFPSSEEDHAFAIEYR